MSFHIPYSPLASPISSPLTNPFTMGQPVQTRRHRPPLSTAATTATVVRPGVSMEDWDARTPLPAIVASSIDQLQARAARPARAPLPLDADDYDGASARGSPRPRSPGSPQMTASKSLGRAAAPHALHPAESIATPQAFYDWLARVDRAGAHAQEAHFRQHLSTLSTHLATCDSLLSLTSAVEADVDAMRADWAAVEAGGRSLQAACAALLDERAELLKAEEALGERMEVFSTLEAAARVLNAPGARLVERADFLDTVARVELCIAFLRSHRSYKEAEVYLLRFEQCLVRAMTLVRMYFVGSLRALGTDVGARLGQDVSATAAHHLLYTRWQSVARPLAPLLRDLERRAAAHPATLGSLLDECHAAYFAARRALLVPRLQAELKGLDPTRADLVPLARAGCGLLREVCADEWALFGAFFRGAGARGALSAYLEGLCDYLYDDLRPRILHESRLSALGEVCAVLRALMVLDAPAPSVDEEDEDEGSDEDENGKRAGLGAPPVGALLAAVLQDAQTRLFFRAQAAVQSELRAFAPQPADLAYPAILLEKDRVDASVPPREKDLGFGAAVFKGARLERRETWYPTLGRAVWLLGQLGEFVPPAIFADLASEALACTRASLAPAAARLPPLDGALFRARHLLILKELARGLDLGLGTAPAPLASSASTSSTASTGRPVPQRAASVASLPPIKASPAPAPEAAGGLAETFAGLLGRAGGMLPAGVQDSLGLARPEEGVDAKHAIDADLTAACEDAIALLAHPTTAPLASLLGAPGAIPPQAAADAARACADAIARDLRAGAARLRLYVPDARTVGVLLGHVSARVREEYGALVGAVGGAGAVEGVQGVEAVEEMLRAALGDGEEDGAGQGPSGSA